MKLSIYLGALLLPLATFASKHQLHDGVSRRGLHLRLSEDLNNSSLSKRAAKSCTKASQCPAVKNGVATCKSKKCAFTCNSGYKKSGSTCAVSCSSASSCKAPANGTPACKSGVCSFTCKLGFKLSSGQCLQTCKKTSNCKVVTNANKPACKSGVCTFTCKSGYTLQNGSCLTKPECAKTADCTNAPTNGYAAGCYNGKCQYDCYVGYDKVGSSCVAQEITLRGNIRLQKWASTSVGYLTTDINTWGQFGFVAERTYAQGFSLTKGFLGAPYALKLSPAKAGFPDFEYLGAASGWNSQDDRLGPALFNYVVFTPSVLTDRYASPEPAASAYLAKTGNPNKIESSAWYHDEGTGQLTLDWVNPNGGRVPTYFFLLQKTMPALIATGDYAEFARSFPDAVGVYLYFDQI